MPHPLKYMPTSLYLTAQLAKRARLARSSICSIPLALDIEDSCLQMCQLMFHLIIDPFSFLRFRIFDDSAVKFDRKQVFSSSLFPRVAKTEPIIRVLNLLKNGMLRHAFLRVGKDISLQQILLPPCN